MIDSFAPIPPSDIDIFPDTHDGYPARMAAEDTPDALWEACGDASRDFPAEWWIEPRDWADAARLNDKYGTWPVNHLDRFTHQGQSHECTAHSLSRAFEATRNLQRGVIYPDGPKAGHRYDESGKYGAVWVSPLSIYAEANPGQWGGASIRQVLSICTRRGFLPEKEQPRDYGFEHALHGTAGGRDSRNQSVGRFLRTSQFPSGWEATAKHLRAQEVILNLSTWEQAVCLVLRGLCYCVGRNGHAIPWSLWNPERQAMGYVDSYDVIRWDSLSTVRSAWRGGYSIASVTTPDSWQEPAK